SRQPAIQAGNAGEQTVGRRWRYGRKGVPVTSGRCGLYPAMLPSIPAHRNSRRRRTMSRFLLLLALGLTCPLAMASDDISKVNGSIRTESGTAYRDLDTVNGSIHLAKGVQARGVETVNGSINVDDNVQARSLETVNGAIRAGRGLVLSGGVETVNGSIFIDQGGRVGGGVETVNGGIGLVGT